MSADLQYTLGLDGSQFDATAKAAEKTGTRLGSVLAGLGVTAFAGGILKRGLDFNQTMRDSEAAVAKVIGQFQRLDEVAARDAAAAAMRQIVELEPKAAGSLADLTGGFLATLAASQAAGLSVSQNIDLVGRFANAMANANIPTEQLGQEMRSIVTANIGADSSLARILGITNEMVKQAQEAGNLYGFLTDKIGKLGLAGDTAAVAFSTLQSAVDKAAGSLASGLFEAALEGSKGLTAEIDRNRETFENFGAALGLVSKEVLKFASFVNEAATQAGRLVAIVGLMISDGASYADAVATVDAVAAARTRDAEAAEAEAAAAKKALDITTKETDAKKKAADLARQATQKAGLAGSGTAPEAAPSKGGKDKEAQDAARAFDEILDKQARLDDLKRQAALDEMTTAEKAAAIRKEVLAVEQEIATLKADPFSQDQGRILDAEARRVDLQREYNDLTRQAAAESDRAAKAAADQAKRQQDQAAAMAQGREGLLGELAILEAQAKGQDRKAEAIRRQLQLEREKRDIMRQTGASEEEAARLAERKADLEAKVAGVVGSGDRVRGKIGGVQAARLMGSPGGGGLDGFKKAQGEDSDFDRLQKGPFGKGGLAERRSSGITSRLMGSPGGGGLDAFRRANSAGSLADRAGAALAPPVRPPDKAKTNQQDPQTAALTAILGELQRIRTA